MAKVPVFGFIYRKTVVTVDRSSAHNRTESIRILKSIISKGVSVMVFPEGTFNMTNKPLKEFYDGAFRLAIETQTPVKPVLFLDTYSRMHYKNIFYMTPGKCRIVYLKEIPVDGLRIENVQVLKQKTYELMEKKLIEYDTAWIASPSKSPPKGETFKPYA